MEMCNTPQKVNKKYWRNKRVIIPKLLQSGMSLIELSISLCILTVLLSAAAPAFTGMLDQHRLKSATSALHSSIQRARSEAIKRNQKIRLTFKTSSQGTVWCYGLKVDAACNCTVPASCQIDGLERIVDSEAFPGVSLDPRISSPGDHFTFENIRWITAGTFGHVRFNSSEAKQIRVIVSRMGRTRICSPEGGAHVAGYATAC